MELVFDSGEKADVDLTCLIAAGGVWACLADKSAFGKVTIGPDGRYLEWPGELDLCADALWVQTHERQHSPT